MNKQSNINDKNLIRRYLVWCYKTTKEELDRIDRYFTQNIVDDYMLQDLVSAEDHLGAFVKEDYKVRVKNFESYKIEKFQKAQEKKFLDVSNNLLTPDYLYIQRRFAAIEKAIVYFLGEDELRRINELYEHEMTLRIISARDHQ